MLGKANRFFDCITFFWNLLSACKLFDFSGSFRLFSVSWQIIHRSVLYFPLCKRLPDDGGKHFLKFSRNLTFTSSHWRRLYNALYVTLEMLQRAPTDQSLELSRVTNQMENKLFQVYSTVRKLSHKKTRKYLIWISSKHILISTFLLFDYIHNLHFNFLIGFFVTVEVLKSWNMCSGKL